MSNPNPVILPFTSPEVTLALAGGKGLNLARLAQAGLPVPPGFVVTTPAYDAFAGSLGEPGWTAALVDPLVAEDLAGIAPVSAAIRARFVEGTVPAWIAEPVVRAYRDMGMPPVAVRSSATAEDLPDLSYAGQQDTYLNVVGEDGLLAALRACWGSLWTERAIAYRARNRIAPGALALAVVVQEMVASEASGVAFTANPVTGKRSELVIDATLGLGEALVAGLVEPDHYVVDAVERTITSKMLGSKALSIRGQAGGGTETVREDLAARQALPDAAILELAALCGRVEALYGGAPQDIEWAWAGNDLYLLQARPVTSLYPLPVGLPAEPLRALASVGAMQGMLDPFTPLGIDFFRHMVGAGGRLFGHRYDDLTQPALFAAGGRLFVDLTGLVRRPFGRRLLAAILSAVEPGIGRGLAQALLDPALAVDRPSFTWRGIRRLTPLLKVAPRIAVNIAAPERARARLQAQMDDYIAGLERMRAGARSLHQRVQVLEAVISGLPLLMFRVIMPTIAPGMATVNWLLQLAKRSGVDRLLVLESARGLPHNVTTQMDLALWDCARRLKADAPAREALAEWEAREISRRYLDGDPLPGVLREVLAGFLAKYGMRGLAEIDLGRPRWRDDPTPVVQTLRNYMGIENPDEAPDRVFARGAQQAEIAVDRLVASIARSPGGFLKARLARWAARRMRALAGLRETPKFFIIRQLGVARAALQDAGAELAAKGVLDRPDDIFWLRLRELRELARGSARREWRELVAERQAEYERDRRRRQIPRILLSDGRAFYSGAAPRPGPGERTLQGSPVSPGQVEGTVRIVLDPHGAEMKPGDVLVCPGTDPSWTPLFLSAVGLVMEVGGLMTHGAVVAREYGIPAVVGVQDVTRLLSTGQRIRVDGTTGEVVLLSGEFGSVATN